VPRELSVTARLGKQLFFDKSLSKSGNLSCSTCHDPQFAYAPPNGLAVQLGGPADTSPGLRAVPSLRYKEYTPAYADLLDNPDGLSEPAPGGGFTWDGRADSLAEQAKLPLLSAFEMANESAAEVVRKLRACSSAALFEQAFGARVFDDIDTAFNDVGLALQAFQLEDPSFHPYSSKFDLNAQHRPSAKFTPAEERGLKVFADPQTGNCASCHFSDASLDDGSSGLFTDFSFEIIGVPRNPEIPANRDRAYSDLGIAGPIRKDHLPKAGKSSPFAGAFKAPTLRNVASRRAFFHNGVMHTLEQAVRFYATRDTMPELWYPTIGGKARATPDASFPRYGLISTQYTGGTLQKFDDLPASQRSNIDRQMPLDGRAAGSEAPLNEQQIMDLLCFLGTLTDADVGTFEAKSAICLD
jgi:cytochrome c peroxidase